MLIVQSSPSTTGRRLDHRNGAVNDGSRLPLEEISPTSFAVLARIRNTTETETQPRHDRRRMSRVQKTADFHCVFRRVYGVLHPYGSSSYRPCQLHKIVLTKNTPN